MNDKRKKGCPNQACQMHIKKVKYSADDAFCPKCGNRLIYVCAKCFGEIEDINEKHRICRACELKKEETGAKRKEQAINVGKKVGGVAVGIGAACVSSFVSETNKQFRKKAVDVSKKAAQMVFKLKK